MAYDGAFQPIGATVLVGVSPVKAPANDGSETQSYRISSLSTSRQYLTWHPETTQQPTLSIAVPANGVPSPNTIGMAAGATETFVLPNNCWFRADAAGAFEVTPGQGL